MFCLFAATVVVFSTRGRDSYQQREVAEVPTAMAPRRSRHSASHANTTSRTSHPLRDDAAAAVWAAASIPQNSRFVCVYHEENRRPGYSPDTFPYAYCHVVAYCCLPVDTSPDDTRALGSIARMAGAHRQLAIVVTAGYGQTDTDLTALFGTWRAGQFTARLLDIRRRTAFRRVYLYWRRPSTLYRDRVTRLAADLAGSLRGYAVGLGFVVDEASVDALDVRRLVAILGQDSLLAAPAPYTWSQANEPYHGYKALQWHSRLSELSGNGSARICHTVSLAGVRAASSTTLPYERLCTARFLRPPMIRESWSSVGRLWGSGALVSFLSPEKARSFVAAVHEEAGSNCLGFWNPECDDFAGRCGGPHYPLIRAVVEHAISRR